MIDMAASHVQSFFDSHGPGLKPGLFAVIGGSSIVTGFSLAGVNQVLQTVAFCVGIVSGCFASRYYYLAIKKAQQK